MPNLMYTWEMIDPNHTKNIGTCLISFTLTRSHFISPPTDSALFSLMRSCLLTGLHHIKGMFCVLLIIVSTITQQIHGRTESFAYDQLGTTGLGK